MLYPTPTIKLIDGLTKLPGIGIRTATRPVSYTTGMLDEDVNEFVKNLLAAKCGLIYCSVYGNLTDEDPCNVYTDKTRDHSVALMAEDSKDVSAMEKAQEYRGLCHVLYGLISPMDGVGPDNIDLKPLITHLMSSEVNRMITVTNATADDRATSMCISRILKPIGIKITRSVRGSAVRSDIEYANKVVLLRTIEG